MQINKLLSFLLISIVSAVKAEECINEPGNIRCGKGTVSSLDGNGIVALMGTTIKGTATVNGLLTADEANFASLNVNGSASLDHCYIHSEMEIKGTLKASSTTFEKGLAIFSNSTKFIDTKIHSNIKVHATDNKIQEIYLENNSEVTGDIVFDEGHGKVYLRGDSKIDGNVIGGVIINN